MAERAHKSRLFAYEKSLGNLKVFTRALSAFDANQSAANAAALISAAKNATRGTYYLAGRGSNYSVNPDHVRQAISTVAQIHSLTAAYMADTPHTKPKWAVLVQKVNALRPNLYVGQIRTHLTTGGAAATPFIVNNLKYDPQWVAINNEAVARGWIPKQKDGFASPEFWSFVAVVAVVGGGIAASSYLGAGATSAESGTGGISAATPSVSAPAASVDSIGSAPIGGNSVLSGMFPTLPASAPSVAPTSLASLVTPSPESAVSSAIKTAGETAVKTVTDTQKVAGAVGSLYTAEQIIVPTKPKTATPVTSDQQLTGGTTASSGSGTLFALLAAAAFAIVAL